MKSWTYRGGIIPEHRWPRRVWLIRMLMVTGVVALAAAGGSRAVAKEGPLAIAASPDGHRVYVTTVPGALQAIDTSTHRVIAGIMPRRTGYNTLTSVAVSPDSTRVYVSRSAATDVWKRNGTLLVLEAATLQTLAEIEVGPYPGGVTCSPDGRRVYVANTDGTISVVDSDALQVSATVPVSVGNGIGGPVMSPDGRRLYVIYLASPSHETQGRKDGVAVIDAETNQIVDRVGVGPLPSGMVVSADGQRLYLCQFETGMQVIDLASHEVLASVKTPSFLLRLWLSPDGASIYGLQSGGTRVFKIDSSTLEVTGQTPVARPSHTLAMSPNGDRLYVINLLDKAVQVIDPASQRVVATVDLESQPANGG